LGFHFVALKHHRPIGWESGVFFWLATAKEDALGESG
jgi:hypothetical protein